MEAEATQGCSPLYVEPRSEVSDAEREAIVDRLQRWLAGVSDVAFGLIHGSFVTADACHDIDIAVYLSESNPDAVSKRAMALAAELEAAVFESQGISLYPPVDVRARNAAPLACAIRSYATDVWWRTATMRFVPSGPRPS